MELENWLRETRRAMVNLNHCPRCKSYKLINVVNMPISARKKASKELADMMIFIRGGVSARSFAISLANPVTQEVFDHAQFVSENFVFRVAKEEYDGCG